jgi:hypothetical protein
MTSAHYIAVARDSRTLELPEEAQLLGIRPGENISITVERETESQATPNESVLEALRIIAEMKKGLRETDGSDTDRILREGRSGAMHGE